MHTKSSPKSIDKLKIHLGSPPIAKLKITPEKLGKVKKSRKRSRPSPEVITTAPQPSTEVQVLKLAAKKPVIRTTSNNEGNIAQFQSSMSPLSSSLSTAEEDSSDTTLQHHAKNRSYSIFRSRNAESGCSGTTEQKEAKYSIFKSRNSDVAAGNRGAIGVIAAAAGGGSGPAAVQFGRREKKTIPSSAALSEWEEGEDSSSSQDFSSPTRREGRRTRPSNDDGENNKDEEDERKTSLLEIDVIDDEFSSVRVAESPNTKVRVVDGSTSGQSPAGCSPRKLVFGLHSPICQDEIRPMGSPMVLILEDGEGDERCSTANSSAAMAVQSCHSAQSRDAQAAAEKPTRPALRTHGRVISSEDALLASDAVVVPTSSHQQLAAVLAPTPTLPILSPHVSTTIAGGEEDEVGQATHSNMTTPSLPSLSPAIGSGSNEARSLATTPVPQVPPLTAADGPTISRVSSSSIVSSPGAVLGQQPVLNSPTKSPMSLFSPPRALSALKARPKNTARKRNLPLYSRDALKKPTVEPVEEHDLVLASEEESHRQPVASSVRRQSLSSEGTLAALDPHMSRPLCVEIPSELAVERTGKGVKVKPAEKKASRRTSVVSSPDVPPTSTADLSSEFQTAVEPALPSEPVSSPSATPPQNHVTTTGRRMRDCRKFIHYEFSPPFVVSDESSTDQESPVSSTSYRDAPYPSPAAAKAESQPSRRGRQPKMKPLDMTETEPSARKKPRGGGRRPKTVAKTDTSPSASLSSLTDNGDGGSVSVSELAQRLAEDHISPITRERLTFSGERRGSLDTPRWER